MYTTKSSLLVGLFIQYGNTSIEVIFLYIRLFSSSQFSVDLHKTMTKNPHVLLTVVGCVIHALRGVYTIGWGFSLMIPRAEAARNTDDFRTKDAPVAGAVDGGCRE